uniref:Uncharacterized protein n=1 Tax=Siphoviridae sp. ctZHD14 TaxID=2827891 RepID=A0A8S5SVZ6_9CAUD|nr:MAG TPA: hypothetical protein [Siphoviridae sp. ctZHD14]
MTPPPPGRSIKCVNGNGNNNHGNRYRKRPDRSERQI